MWRRTRDQEWQIRNQRDKGKEWAERETCRLQENMNWRLFFLLSFPLPEQKWPRVTQARLLFGRCPPHFVFFNFLRGEWAQRRAVGRSEGSFRRSPPHVLARCQLLNWKCDATLISPFCFSESSIIFNLAPLGLCGSPERDRKNFLSLGSPSAPTFHYNPCQKGGLHEIHVILVCTLNNKLNDVSTMLHLRFRRLPCCLKFRIKTEPA